MLTSTRQLIATLILFALATPLHSAESAADANPQIDELMQITGLKQVIEGFPEEIEAQINHQKTINPEAALSDEESRLLFSHFKTETIYTSLQQHLAANLDRNEIDTLLKMHKAPLMKRIVAAEIASSSIKAQKEMTAFVAKLRDKPPSESRIKMIRQLDRASMSTESVVYIMEAMMLGMGEMMLERSGKYSSAEKAQMEKVIANTTRLIEGELRQQIIMSMHYIYRDFSDDEVMRYIKQLNSDENQHYTRAAVKGIGNVIIDAFKHGIDQLMQLRHAKAV